MIPENRIENSSITSTNRKRSRAFIAFRIIESILIFSIILLYYLTLPMTSSKVLFIPKGSTNNIINYLNKSSYDMNIIDEIVIKTTGYIQSGWIDIGQTQLTKMDFIQRLVHSKAAMKNITLIPGETYYVFLRKLAKEFELNEKKLFKVYSEFAHRLDGNILADTYSLPIGMNEDYIILYLFSQTDKKYEEFSTKIFGSYDKKKWYNYITLASIIQKEAATTNEMPIVASVIHNRLKKGMALQMDGTLNYGKHSNEVITAERIRTDESSYNTYKYKGLPKDPVCAVSLDSIKAGIFPVKSDYLYFVRDNKTGLHKFSNSYEAHQTNINSNIGVTKTYTKVKEQETNIDTQASDIMKTDITKQKAPSIKDLFNSIN